MLKVRTSPHIHDSVSTPAAMMMVSAALLPSAIWGCILFGFRAFLVLLVSVVSSMGAEYIMGRFVSHESTLDDWSALVTGLLVGMNMTSTVPLFVPAIASVFAIVVVKWTFGGLGCNWANPAIAGRVFVFFSFSSLMSTTVLPRFLSGGADLVTGATVLSVIKTESSALSSSAVLSAMGMPVSGIATKIAGALGCSAYNVDAFLGISGGAIGETSALLLVLGGIYLIWKRVITWHIPVTYILSYAVLTYVFGGIPYGNGLCSGEVVLPLFSGGMMLGAIFMATDWVTTPNTKRGEIIYATGCGFFTFLIRSFGSLPEGVSLAILLMNMVTPTIDRFVRPVRFGEVKAKEEGK